MCGVAQENIPSQYRFKDTGGHCSLYRSSLGLDGCEVRLCDPCVRVCACVSRVCVPAPPGVFLPVILVHVLVFRVLVRVLGTWAWCVVCRGGMMELKACLVSSLSRSRCQAVAWPEDLWGNAWLAFYFHVSHSADLTDDLCISHASALLSAHAITEYGKSDCLWNVGST